MGASRARNNDNDNDTHFFTTAMDDGPQSCPEFAYGLTAYGRTFSITRISVVLDVARHGGVEFSGIK